MKHELPSSMPLLAQRASQRAVGGLSRTIEPHGLVGGQDHVDAKPLRLEIAHRNYRRRFISQGSQDALLVVDQAGGAELDETLRKQTDRRLRQIDAPSDRAAIAPGRGFWSTSGW